MIIKINNFSVISHKEKSDIVSKYFEQFETSKMTNNGWLNSLSEEYTIKETGKYPVIIRTNRNYHVKCNTNKTKTTIIFDIWLA